MLPMLMRRRNDAYSCLKKGKITLMRTNYQVCLKKQRRNHKYVVEELDELR